MATYNTNQCTITAGGGSLAGFVMDMTVTLTMSTVEVTAVGDSDQFFVPGIRGGSATGNIYYDQNNTTVKALETARQTGAEVTFVFTWHSAASYTAQAIVTQFAPTITHNDVVKASISLQFTGAVTISA